MPEAAPAIRDEEWFRMVQIRQRRIAAAVWIPLRLSETLEMGGVDGKPGFYKETFCAGSLAVHLNQREVGERLGWNDIGLGHEAGPYAFSDGRYKPADQYLYNEAEPPVGVDLVVLNRLNSDHQTEWLVNQDLITALHLLRENDVWVAPNEGYLEVIRQRRDSDNTIVAIEIRAEFLRDYLCARGLALRLSTYRQRLQILSDASHIPWHGNDVQENLKGEQFELRTFSIHMDGGMPGRVAIMKAWRTDVDQDVDVPEFGPENDTNTGFESYEFEREGPIQVRVEGELWRDEWIEPAARSERVRADASPEQFYYSIDAAGERKPANELNHEEVGLYLWFKADVIESLLRYRGSRLQWHTSETGSVRCSPDYRIYFGINVNCHINVYACDIARLPQWQQRIWHGFNLTPDGPPSKELQSAQFKCEPAVTIAPEVGFESLLEKLNVLFCSKYGAPLFKAHEHSAQILAKCHRFRALEENGLLALAKDVARITADSIDVGLLKKHVKLASGENLKGLKLLERLLADHSDKDVAREIMGALHIAYGLRLGDAHLPSKDDLASAIAALHIPNGLPQLLVATVFLARVCDSLNAIGRTIAGGPKPESEKADEPTVN